MFMLIRHAHNLLTMFILLTPIQFYADKTLSYMPHKVLLTVDLVYQSRGRRHTCVAIVPWECQTSPADAKVVAWLAYLLLRLIVAQLCRRPFLAYCAVSS